MDTFLWHVPKIQDTRAKWDGPIEPVKYAKITLIIQFVSMPWNLEGTEFVTLVHFYEIV